MGFKTLNNSKLRSALLFVVVCFVCFLTYLMQYRVSEIELTPCKLMTLNPWDPALRPYLVFEPPVMCSKREQLMLVDKGYLIFNDTVLKKYHINKGYVKCYYSNLRRNGDKDVIFEIEVAFKTPVFIKSHVFRVRCFDAYRDLFYDYLHVNPVWNDDSKKEEHIEDESESKLSVIIFGLDSVSRSHAIRSLPESYKFLKEDLQAYDFEGFSKVGENTIENLYPLLTGQAHRNFPFVVHLRKYADSLPLIWSEKIVKDHFATLHAEDGSSVFSGGNRGGFKDQHTDFYFHPFLVGMHKFEPKIIDFLGKTSDTCYGINTHLEIEIAYLKAFVVRYQRKRKYAFLWNYQASHDNFTRLPHEDNRLFRFLKWFKNSNYTLNTIFILLGDHGYRLGGPSLTHIGRAENNRPWLMVYVPDYLKRKFPWIHESLSKNTKRLVSMYDLYQTTYDLVHDVAFTREKSSTTIGNIVRRNIFYEIPRERTCLDAGIQKRYCMCDEKVSISTSLNLVYSLAKFLVNEINNILSKYHDVCNVLSLQNVTEAKVLYSVSDTHTFGNIPNAPKGIFNTIMRRFSTNQDQTGRYFILFHTNFGNAYFEGCVDYAEYGANGARNEMTMTEEPFRLDKYGNQSYCVKDSFLKPFCYCKNFEQPLNTNS